MAHKRLSLSEFQMRYGTVQVSAKDTQEWVKGWESTLAKDLIDSRIVSVDAKTSVEDACEALLREDILCLVVKTDESDPSSTVSLFDFSDVNAFLTLAATRHTLLHDDLRDNPRVDNIVSAARAGHVPVHLVSNLSDKNPLQTLPPDATVISLLELFSRGTHRVLIQSPSSPNDFDGIVSDRGLLSWFFSYAQETPSLQQFLSNPLHSFSLPSLNLFSSVVSATSTHTVLDAMKLMSEEGVGSIAVLDEASEALISAVSVTDIGKIVVPSESKSILSTPLHTFISQIKEPHGSTDGADQYPAYSVLPTTSVSYAIQKLLATNAHRLFVTRDASESASSIGSRNLTGIVSTVDILSLFARVANIPDVDPTHMQRHRRASSSASSHSSGSRSSSRTGITRAALRASLDGSVPRS